LGLTFKFEFEFFVQGYDVEISFFWEKNLSKKNPYVKFFGLKIK
jgi:hypothetical protein